ncbi:hypothetical protein NKR19_g9944 [Coniochaeta hoffmannii]|uniref:Uncharacterized protein n=1 Tax=Coniochaeta hoffmannii TaxID=91930 RepID=A0AA38R8F1_9PEZI|nr:hypothetical protein NKR19_g9944 [Coniochaeta hoffmannii]
MAATQENNNKQEVPELLYHTLLTVIDFHDDTSGYTRSTYPLGTHTSLSAAKAFAAHALEKLNYQPDDFLEYAVRTPQTPEDAWTHGDGTVVYAKAPAGHEFLVRLDTTVNNENLPAGGPDETPRLPSASDHLHYVIQTRIDYDQDRSGSMQHTEIEGVYVHRADALKAAKDMLGDRQEFAQYDENTNGEKGEWPFGEDVVVHAVAQTGQNYTIAVRTVPGCHKKHTKHAKKVKG